MPSDAHTQTALEALEGPRNAFLSAVAAADEEVRAYRGRHAGTSDPAAALGSELGLFARGRVDPARMAGLMAVAEAPDPLTDRLMGVAHDLFAEVTAGAADAFQVQVPPGGDVRDAVRDALAALGRAFGVAHAVEKARSHRYDPDTDHTLLHRHPFHQWTPRERRLAPPLVVSVKGQDLRPAGLAEFLTGSVKIVLLVDGRVTPAPLARLISSEVFVAQTTDPAVLKALAAYDGPGIVAWTHENAGAVSFVHDPASGRRTWERVHAAGGVDALGRVLNELENARGGPADGAGDLRHLLELATAPGVEPATNGTDSGPAAEDPADRLAAWLLARTDLKGI